MARAGDGRVVFVQGAAPNEDVLATLTRSRGRHAEARVVRVLSPGPARVDPGCPHFGVCGGCVLQHVDPAAQTEAKGRLLQDTLARLGGVDPIRTTFDAPWAGEAYGYRTRARLAVSAGGRLGYRAMRSRSVVPVDRCSILHPVLESVRAALSERLAEARSAAPGKGAEVQLVTNGERVAARLPRSLSRLQRDVARFPAPVVFGPHARVEAGDGRGPLWLVPSLFAQANRTGNQALVDAVGEAVRRAAAGRVLELYAGTGNLTRTITKHAKVWALEGDGAAARLGRETLREVIYKVGPVEETAARLFEDGARFDAVVVDPPRAGLSPSVVATLAALAAGTLVYVSCDAATFARDAGRLVQHGYRLARARLFDLYPQTAHLEVFGVFTRPEARGAEEHRRRDP